MDLPTLQGYLFLSHYSSLSDLKFSRLLQSFGNLNSIFEASPQQLTALGVNPGIVEGIAHAAQRAKIDPRVQESLEWSLLDKHTILCYEDPLYPVLLKEIDHPPPVMYIKGNPELLDRDQIAIVGSRKASPYGLSTAFEIAKQLSACGFAITSGLAGGIDSRAHEGALEQGGSTIAVIGTGIDRCYPAKNNLLSAEIAEKGVIVSEFPLGSSPLAHHFPRRNRIISGLSLGVIVVEAALRSGSLISARLAIEQNREVFAVPGMISNPLSAGCHQLIREGAKLVASAEDVAEEFPLLRTGLMRFQDRKLIGSAVDKTGRACTSPIQEKIISMLKSQPCLLDTLVAETKIELSDLVDNLTYLETEGVISLEAGRYCYCKQ